MPLIYFLAAAAVLKTVEYLINSALARRRPATPTHAALVANRTDTIVDITLGRTIGAWIVALPVDLFAGRFVHGMTEYRFFPAQLPMYVFFIAIMVAATFTAFRWSRRLYRFGRSFIRLELTNAAVDGRLTGTLQIPRHLPPGTVIHLELTCTRTTSDGGLRNNPNIRQVIEYDQGQDIDPSSSLNSIEAIPFEFSIPANASPTTATHKLSFFRISHAWALTAASTTPGVDFWAKFVVPIAGKNKGDITGSVDNPQITLARCKLCPVNMPEIRGFDRWPSRDGSRNAGYLQSRTSLFVCLPKLKSDVRLCR